MHQGEGGHCCLGQGERAAGAGGAGEARVRSDVRLSALRLKGCP
jgi:hypothetical protein